MSDNKLTDKELFEFYREEITQETNFFWSRFFGFSALQAGLFTIIDKPNVHFIGAVLSLVWLFIQIISREYQGRYKKSYQEIGKKIDHPDFVNNCNCSCRSSNLFFFTIITPIIIGIFWLRQIICL